MHRQAPLLVNRRPHSIYKHQIRTNSILRIERKKNREKNEIN